MTQKTDYYIIRHGQDEDNAKGILNGHRDENLTDLGKQQAIELANTIKHLEITFDFVYSSPLKRALETAKIVSEINQLPQPLILQGLIERDFGVMTGKSISDIEKICTPNIIKTERVTYFLDPQDAETFPKLLERAEFVLNYLNSKHSSGSILLTTSGDIGKMLYAKYYNMEWQDVLKEFHFGNCDVLILSKNSQNKIIKSGQK